MDLIKGYFGLIFILLFSIEFIICSGIFDIIDNSLIEMSFSILACLTNFAIFIYCASTPLVN